MNVLGNICCFQILRGLSPGVLPLENLGVRLQVLQFGPATRYGPISSPYL